MRKFLTIIIALVLGVSMSMADDRVYTPEEMVNPNIANRYHYICDPAHLLSSQTTDEVNKRLYNLRNQTTCEVLVAIAPSIGDQLPEEWCEQVFTRWGIGKKDKDNGALLVIVPGDRLVRIQTGYGVEGVLTDIACNNIIRKAVYPNMREGNLDAAVNQATALMTEALTDPAVADELRSQEADNYGGVGIRALNRDVLLTFLNWCIGIFFAIALLLFIMDLVKGRKLDGYHRSILWRDNIRIFSWLSVFTAGLGLVFLFGAWLLYRRARTKKLKCPTCGTKMNRLSESEDNELLNESQDFEEKINTVDYDVWECPKCGTIERFPYKTDQKKYTECPACHTIAMCLDHETILRPATTRSEGIGEKVYVCQFCGHNHRQRFKIPRKEDPTDALAAAAVLGSLGRGGGSGGFGSGFGGGLGGGSTGGGGATGHW